VQRVRPRLQRCADAGGQVSRPHADTAPPDYRMAEQPLMALKEAIGRWHSGAYLRYLRQTRGRALMNLTLVAGADTDDMEADFVDIDAHGYNGDDDA
jgi:hypothetical protein